MKKITCLSSKTLSTFVKGTCAYIPVSEITLHLHPNKAEFTNGPFVLYCECPEQRVSCQYRELPKTDTKPQAIESWMHWVKYQNICFLQKKEVDLSGQ